MMNDWIMDVSKFPVKQAPAPDIRLDLEGEKLYLVLNGARVSAVDLSTIRPASKSKGKK